MYDAPDHMNSAVHVLSVLALKCRLLRCVSRMTLRLVVWRIIETCGLRLDVSTALRYAQHDEWGVGV